MFDRAVSLYRQNALALFGIVAVTALPLALLQYPVTRLEQPQLDAMIRIFEHPELANAHHIPPAFGSPIALGLSVVLTLLEYLAWAFCLAAIAEGVAAVYRGSPIEFAACFTCPATPSLFFPPTPVGQLGFALVPTLAFHSGLTFER